jgi:hypothetical protein
MMRSLAIIAAGVFCVWIGVRSMGGYESDTEHLYGGEFEAITCEDGNAVAGKGMHALSAERACVEEQAQQRNRGPWWIALGFGVGLFGISRFRKARAAA